MRVAADPAALSSIFYPLLHSPCPPCLRGEFGRRNKDGLLALLFLLDRLLGAALGFHEAAHVAAGAGLHALGLGLLGGRRDGLVAGAADDLADVALDAL